MKKYYTLDEMAKSKGIPFCVQSAKLDGSFDVHSHNFSELVVILNGTATHIIDGREYFIKSGDVYVLSGDTSHGFKDVRDLALCNVMYYSDRLFTVGSSLRKLPGFQALFVLEPYYRKEHRFKYRLQLAPLKLKYVKGLLDVMQREYDKCMEGCEAVLQAYFMSLVAYLSREYVSVPDSQNSRSELMSLAETVAYMERHYTEPITLKQLSAGLSISCRHFIRIFRQNYQSTPMDYIIRLRLKHALELLKDNRLAITQVAYESGFTDSNYFSRQFRERYGVSPRSYRAMVSLGQCP